MQLDKTVIVISLKGNVSNIEVNENHKTFFLHMKTPFGSHKIHHCSPYVAILPHSIHFHTQIPQQ
jgi:hypothetical protein